MSEAIGIVMHISSNVCAMFKLDSLSVSLLFAFKNEFAKLQRQVYVTINRVVHTKFGTFSSVPLLHLAMLKFCGYAAYS